MSAVGACQHAIDKHRNGKSKDAPQGLYVIEEKSDADAQKTLQKTRDGNDMKDWDSKNIIGLVK
jgi:hypothetical protein